MVCRQQYTALALATILSSLPLGGNAFAFSPAHKVLSSRVNENKGLYASSNDNDESKAFATSSRNAVVGGAATFFAGLGLAAQIALANPPAQEFVAGAGAGADNVQSVARSISSSYLTISAGAPSFGKTDTFETLDFSLPSYSEATGGEATETKSEAPLFSNPFASDKSSTESDESAAKNAIQEKMDAAKQAAEEKAANAKRIAEEKAEEAARKAQLKAERLAATKKAAEEQAARREKEAEAAKEEQAAPAPEPVKEERESPSFEKPDFKVPEFKAPDVKLPSFSAPKFDLPTSKVPSGDNTDEAKPAFKAPEFKAPEIKVPSFSTPKFDIPATPKIDAPRTNVEYDSEEFGLSQEERDAKAKEARSAFEATDADAKAIEKEAREVREKANVAKKAAQEAKDEACKSRPGGKLICLRGFGSGY